MNDNVVKGAVLATALAVSGGIGAAISSSSAPSVTSKVEQGCRCEVVQSDDPGRRYCGGNRPLKVECECAAGTTPTGIQVMCGK